MLWTLDELRLESRRVDVGGPYGGLEEAAYRAMNPNRRIPTLRDGELVLWESNVIVRYLAARYGEDSLWIANPVDRALAERWMDWQHTTLLDDMRTVFVGLAQTAELDRDERAIAAAAERLIDIWGRLDHHLQTRPFVAGGQFTMADIPAAAWCHRYHAVDVDRSKLSGLTAWYQRMAERPAYRRRVMEPAL